MGIDQFIPFPAWMDPIGWGTGFARLGYRYRTESTTGSDFDSTSHWPVMTLGVPLPQEVLLLVNSSYERRRYQTPSVFEISAGDRLDRIFQTRVALRRPLFRGQSIPFQRLGVILRNTIA